MMEQQYQALSGGVPTYNPPQERDNNTKTYLQNRPKDLYVIYIDGGSRFVGKGRKIGAWAFYDEKENYSMTKAIPDATNNQMELTSAIKALKYAKTRNIQIAINIKTDSEYVRFGMLFWTKKWVANGWKRVNKDGQTEDVKNLELWKELYNIAQGMTIYWDKVKAHSGVEGNERVDTLCTESINKFLQMGNESSVSSKQGLE